MSVVWKFPLYPSDPVELKLPGGAKILHLGVQRDAPTIWVQVDDSRAADERRWFRVVGTGVWFDDTKATYIGTAQQFGGDLVWHLYEVPVIGGPDGGSDDGR